MTQLPTLFISHGAPTLAIEPSPARNFLQSLGHELKRPSAILVVSAHWESEHVGLLLGPRELPTIHDFNGFEQALYDIRYPAPAMSDIGVAIATKLKQAGFSVSANNSRGLDHGAWVPLSLMFPEADIPVTQLSVNPRQPAEYHWRLGRALSSLRKEDVLIIGSGSLTHNLGDIANFHRQRQGIETAPYVTEFCDWVEEKIRDRDLDALLEFTDRAPHAHRAHPSVEHFLPLHVALGAAGVSWQGERIHHSSIYGVISMDSYQFTTSNETH